MRRVALNRSGRRALRPPPGHDRARLRPHQVQPPLRPIPQTRQIGLPVGMATHHRHPQPAQALQAHHRATGRLSGPGGPGQRHRRPPRRAHQHAPAPGATNPLRDSLACQRHCREAATECRFARIAGATAAPRDSPACRPLRLSQQPRRRQIALGGKREPPRLPQRVKCQRRYDRPRSASRLDLVVQSPRFRALR